MIITILYAPSSGNVQVSLEVPKDEKPVAKELLDNVLIPSIGDALAASLQAPLCPEDLPKITALSQLHAGLKAESLKNTPPAPGQAGSFLSRLGITMKGVNA